jgi:hypothetical protein
LVFLEFDASEWHWRRINDSGDGKRHTILWAREFTSGFLAIEIRAKQILMPFLEGQRCLKNGWIIALQQN